MSTGKWAQPGVPHRGWSCVDVEDLEEPAAVCEMCEVREIRYVHHMQHSDYPERLRVGCICAEHMEEDYVGPRRREKRLRARARRRESWAEREWRCSQQGNPYLNTEGFHLVIFPQGHGWRVRVTNRRTARSRPGTRLYPSEHAAQIAALDALLWAKDHLA